MKKITARHRRAADLVLEKNRTKASVGLEFGVTARTIKRWIDAIYPPPPPQLMKTMNGWPLKIVHEHGSLFPQRYRDLNSSQRIRLRERYIEHFRGECLYCGERLDNDPNDLVCEAADIIEWDYLPGLKKGFLSNPVHLHHAHETGLTLGPVHALCNAHSWHFYELPSQMKKFIGKIESLSDNEREDFVARVRRHFV